MLSSRLLIAVLGVPLAASFDVDGLTSLLNTLPDEVADRCLVVRDMLVDYPRLHFDQPPKVQWRSAELELFRDRYIPAVGDLLAAAARYPQLVVEQQPPDRWEFSPLGQALQNLVRFQGVRSCFDVSLAPDTSIIALEMAKVEFGALNDMYSSFFGRLLRQIAREDPQLSLKAAPFRPMFEIRSMLGFGEAMTWKLGLTGKNLGCPIVLKAMEREDERLAMQDWLEISDRRLVQLFFELQTTMREMEEMKLVSPWLLEQLAGWILLNRQSAARIEEPKSTDTAGINADLPVFAKMLKKLRARVLILMTMLRLDAPRVPGEAQAPSTLKNELDKFMSIQEYYRGLNRVRIFLENPSGTLKDLMEMVGILNCRYDYKITYFKNCASVLAALSNSLVEGQDASLLGGKTLDLLSEVYALVEQIVDVYAKIFNLGRQITGGDDQSIRFLLNFFGRTENGSILICAKEIMDCAYPLLPEATRGAEYDWFNFPLRTILPLPSITGKGAGSG